MVYIKFSFFIKCIIYIHKCDFYLKICTVNEQFIYIVSSQNCELHKYFPMKFIHQRNSYFYIEKWTFKIMCEVCYRAKRDKKEAT